ncbi:MAG: DUF4179 domain-containing protein [Anaerolineales bacterium]|nr:DUF4179 domain-containing protein [Anaerolineales bacterium]
MIADLKKFIRNLDQLLDGRDTRANDPALQAAKALLTLDLDSESKPPAELRARWGRRVNPSTKRKTFMQTLRTRPVLVVLIALLILLALSGVAYAIGKSLGYIPGLGIVDQSAPLQVLAEPVSQTQDGITITVKDAIASADKTIVTYAVENIPPEKLSPAKDVPCPDWPQLKLPDGTLYELSGGDGNVHEMRLIYAPLPANVQDVTLLIPCIQGAGHVTLPLPENWELPIRFIPAPADMTVFSVTELTPSPAAEANVVKNPLTITKVIETNDSYILTGELLVPLPLGQSDSGVYGLRITDGNGKDVSFEGFPQDIGMPTPTSPNAEVWSVKFDKGFVPPIQITYTKQYILADSSLETIEFDFDAGDDPQKVQAWQLDREFTLADRTFTLNSVSALPNSYEFNFTSTDNSIYSVDVVIDGYPPDANGGGMDAGMVGVFGSWSVSVGPYKELPKGKLKVTISHPWLIGEIKDWTVDWQP